MPRRADHRVGLRRSVIQDPPDEKDVMRKKLRSEMGWSSPDKVVVRGHDLTELIGNVSLGDFAFLELKGRLPTPQESVVFNAIAVTLVEHGVTPSAIAARMTYLGAPEALQGAVAAGLLGMGTASAGPRRRSPACFRRRSRMQATTPTCRPLPKGSSPGRSRRSEPFRGWVTP